MMLSSLREWFTAKYFFECSETDGSQIRRIGRETNESRTTTIKGKGWSIVLIRHNIFPKFSWNFCYNCLF